jgi:transposase
MKDTELYRQLLGVEAPWRVEAVELSVSDQRVEVTVGHGRGVRFNCPECQKDLSVYDHSDKRAWRHLDSCGFTTWLVARPPRVECSEHGVRQVRLPWAEPHSRFTALFERLAIDVLGETDVSGACQILRISWDEAWHLMDRAVARGLGRKPHRVPALIGVDEKAARKGHRYVTIVCDLERSTVEYIADDRRESSLDGYFEAFSPEELARIRAVSADMWDPYLYSIADHLQDADSKVVFDRFHIMKRMATGVDTVRKQENRLLLREGSALLKGSKYLWLYSFENLPDHHLERFDDLRNHQLKTARAWAIKESLRLLWDCETRSSAEQYWKRWYFWATHSRLVPIVEVAKTIRRHLPGVLNYFSAARITNAVAEGLNSKIGTIKKMAYGFRNRDHFKTAILFHCGGLDLYPAIDTHGNPG